MQSLVEIRTTTDAREEAQAIAAALTNERLAACVQIIGPVESRYWWRGKIETVEEWICLAKTRQDLVGRAEDVIRRIHSYELPEIVVTRIVGGEREYLDWISTETCES